MQWWKVPSKRRKWTAIRTPKKTRSVLEGAMLKLRYKWWSGTGHAKKRGGLFRFLFPLILPQQTPESSRVEMRGRKTWLLQALAFKPPLGMLKAWFSEEKEEVAQTSAETPDFIFWCTCVHLPDFLTGDDVNQAGLPLSCTLCLLVFLKIQALSHEDWRLKNRLGFPASNDPATPV